MFEGGLGIPAGRGQGLPIHSACRRGGLARAYQLGQFSLKTKGHLANVGYRRMDQTRLGVMVVKMTNQTKSFLQGGEADNWYARNKTALMQPPETKDEFPDVAHIFSTLHPFKDKLNSILELGCSNGAKLEQLCHKFNATGQGIDPSQLAVNEGNQRLSRQKQVKLHVGTASSLPFETDMFDLVYFGFCLYLIDRDDLLMAAAEADRVLKKGGFLVIHDFDPTHRHKREYHHKEGVFSYKQDYAKLFSESGLYYLVSKYSFSHRQPFFDYDGNERVSLTLLFKEIEPYVRIPQESS